MSEEKCHLEGMPWYSICLSGGLVCRVGDSLCKCDSCGNYTCINHIYTVYCDRCTTLQDKWENYNIREKYEKLYHSMIKACKQ